MVGTAGPARAGFILTFQDIAIPGDTDSPPFFTYQSQGFTLTATNPPTGFLSGFQAHGPNSIFYAGAIGVSPFAPGAAPDNVITLTQDDGTPFSLLSIDLARNFPFDPAPTVTFTGDLAGGGTVTQTFTVTTPVGTRRLSDLHPPGVHGPAVGQLGAARSGRGPPPVHQRQPGNSRSGPRTFHVDLAGHRRHSYLRLRLAAAQEPGWGGEGVTSGGTAGSFGAVDGHGHRTE